MSYVQLGKRLVVGVCKELKYVEEMRVLSFLLATSLPVPPLTACRQQFISGPDRGCRRKWEEIWSIWWHYKARCWFAGSIKTWSRLHHHSRLGTASHTWSRHAERLTGLSLQQNQPDSRRASQQSSKLTLLIQVNCLQVGKLGDEGEDFTCVAWINLHAPNCLPQIWRYWAH